MRRSAVLGLLLLALSGGLVVAGMDTAAVIRDLIGVFNDMATTIEKAKKAEDARPSLEKQVAKFAEVKRNFEKAKPKPEEEAELKKKYEPEINKAIGRYITAIQGLAKRDPQGIATLQPLFEKMGGAKK